MSVITYEGLIKKDIAKNMVISVLFSMSNTKRSINMKKNYVLSYLIHSSLNKVLDVITRTWLSLNYYISTGVGVLCLVI